MVSQDKSQNALSYQKKHNPIFRVFWVTNCDEGKHPSENNPITVNIFSYQILTVTEECESGNNWIGHWKRCISYELKMFIFIEITRQGAAVLHSAKKDLVFVFIFHLQMRAPGMR